MYRSVILHVSLASTKTIFVLSCFALMYLLQRKKVSPKGFPFVRCAAGLATSLAVWSVALWAKGTPIDFCLSPSYGFCFRCFLSYLFVVWPIGLSFVITLSIIFNFWFVALLRFYVNEWN